MSNKQTSIEWLIDRVENVDNISEMWERIKTKAKEMHKAEQETMYTEEQVREVIRLSRVTNTTNVIGGGVKLHTYSDNEIIQSLKQPKKD